MDRRTRLMLDQRRKESASPKAKIANKDGTPSNASIKEKKLSYLQSNQIIQSLSARPATANEPTSISKSFKIPRKQALSNDTPRSLNETETMQSKRSRPDGGPKYMDSRFGQLQRKQAVRKEIPQNASKVAKKQVTDVPLKIQESSEESSDKEPADLPGQLSGNPAALSTLPPNANKKSNKCGELNILKMEPTKIIEKRGKRMNGKIKSHPPIKSVILDRSQPDGQISPSNFQILKQRLADIVKEQLLEETDWPVTYYSPIHEDGKFSIICCSEFSFNTLKKKIAQMSAPWSDADLDCKHIENEEHIVEMAIPSSISHISELFDICGKDNENLDTSQWRRVYVTDSADRSKRIFQIAIDSKSYEFIKGNEGEIKFGEERIRVNLNPVLPNEKKPFFGIG